MGNGEWKMENGEWYFLFFCVVGLKKDYLYSFFQDCGFFNQFRSPVYLTRVMA